MQLGDATALRYVPTFLGAHGVPPEYRSRRDEYVSLIIGEMLPAIANQKLAEFCDVFCEQKVFTTDEAWKILSAARCHGLGLRSEEHTSELQSRLHLVCRLLLEKKKKKQNTDY